MKWALGRLNISAVMHFAAYAYVSESVQDPAKYYQGNVSATISLPDSMIRADSSAITNTTPQSNFNNLLFVRTA